MKNFNGRRHSIWIFICIFGCVVTDGKALICNRHEREHSRTLDDEDIKTNVRHPREPNIITDYTTYKDNAFTADKRVNYEVNNNNNIARQVNIEAVPNGFNIIERPNHKDGQNKDYQSYINRFNTKDHKYNYNTNSEEVIPKLHDITTIYLAGYDNQIINLMNDIQKHGTGREVLVYFYLFINNDFRNIGNFYTNKNILRDCITRYNHYFCVGHNINDCSCLRNVKSNNREIVEINPEIKNEELNKIDHTGNTSGQELNIKADANKIHNINDTTSEFKLNYPEKQSTGSYEFILPGEKDVNFKNVFLDILHPKLSEALAENKMVQNLDNVKNDAEHKVEIRNNTVSGNNVASSLPNLDQQNLLYDLQGIPDAAINVDPITISTRTSNLDKNLNYINGITDQRHNLAYDVPNINLTDTDTSSVLQLQTGTYEEQVNIPLISNPNMQLLDSSIDIKPDVQKNPNLESQNMILQKTTSLPINFRPFDQTNEPKISNDEYVIYSRNIPEQTLGDTRSVNQAVGYGIGIPVTLTPGQIYRAIEINPDLEYANDIKEAVSRKLNDENILINPIQSNASIEVNGVIPEINNENKIALETNAIDGQILNEKSNFITIDNNPKQNQSIDDVVVFSSSTPTSRKLDIEQGNLIPDLPDTAQVNKDIERTYRVESGTIKNTENDVPSYVNYINSHLHEPYSLLVVNEEDKNNAPKFSAKENVNTQSPYYSNIDSLVNSNHYNIPTFSTNRKYIPQNVHNRNNYGYHVNTPYNYMNYQLIRNKPQLHHHHHRWNFLQNGDFIKQNQSRFQSLDQPHKFDVREQWPYHFSQPISGVIDGHYDLQGNNQHNHGLTKPNINQNENLYTPDPVKIMLNPNIILKPLLSNHKNIVKNPEPVTNTKTESILDLSQINLDDKYNQQNPQEVITTQFREERPPKNLNRRKNYDDFIINLPDKGKEHPENDVDYNNNPFKYNDISSPITFLPHYPHTGKHFSGFYSNVGSDVYHMLDPCTYKNILTLEGHGNPTAETTSTLANSTELTDKGDNLLVDYEAPPSQPHSFGVFVPTYDHFHIPANIPSKLNTNTPPINPYYNSHLSSLSQIGNLLTSEIDLSYKDQYDISNIKKPTVFPKHTHPIVETVPIFSMDNNIPRTKENSPLTFNDIVENNVSHKDSFAEPIINYINNIQHTHTPKYIGEMPKFDPLNKLGLNSSRLLYPPYLKHNNPLIIPSRSHSLLPSKSKELKGFLQPEKMHYIGPYRYSTITPKAQPLAHDVTVTGLSNNDNSIPMILNNALLPNVSPTVLNPYNKKVESTLPKFIYPTVIGPFYHPSSSCTVTPMTAYYPFASIPVTPLKDTTTVTHADLSTNSILPGPTPGLIEQKTYTSEAQYMPKSKYISHLLPSKGECSSTNTQSSIADSQNSFNLEPCTTFLPSKQYKTETLLEKGNILNSYEPAPCYSENITPITTASVIPHLHPSKIPFYKALPQNVETYVNKFPSDSSSAPELSNMMPSIETQGTKSFIDTVNYPYYSHASPVNADLSSFTQSQNTISFVPNSYKTNPNTLYGDQYSTSPNKPISTNIIRSRNSEFLPTISSMGKPRSFKTNLYTKHIIHSPYYNLRSFAKPYKLYDQEFQKYLTPIQNLENLSPNLVSSTNDIMPISHHTADLKPLVFSPNYSIAPRFTNGNIDPWKLFNYNILPKTQSMGKTDSPRVDKAIVSPVQGNAESVPLAISETPSLPMQNLNPSNLNPSLSTKHNPHYSVQPSQYSENFANLIPCHTISPYSYTPGPSQNKVTWISPSSRIESNHQVNCINTNFASIYQIPAVKPGYWSKEFPIQYAGYGLPTEIPKYGQPGQINYLEPNPLNKIANIDSFIDEPKLVSQPTISTISTLGGQAISVQNQPTQIKTLSNYILPSLFLGSEKPKSTPFHTFIPSPSAYLQNEVSSIPASLNKMTHPFATSEIPIPGFDTSSSFELSPLQKNKLLPNVVTKIPLIQETLSDLAVSPSTISVSPTNLVPSSISFKVTPKPASNLPVTSLPLGFHSHDSSPFNPYSNNLKNLWSYLLPLSQVSKSKGEKPLLRNFTPLTPFYMDVTSTPVIGTAPTYSRTAISSNEIPSTVLTIGLPLSTTISKPILPTPYLSPCFHDLSAKINFVPQTNKMPIDSSGLAYQTCPSVLINDYININKPNLSFSNLQGSQPIISTLPNPKTFNLTPKTTIIWSNLNKNRNFTPPFISSDPISVSSHSEPKQSIHALPVSSSLSMKGPYQSALDYSSGSAISLPSLSICSTSDRLLWKPLTSCIHKPGLTHDANTWSSPSATSIPHIHIPTLAEKILDEAQLTPNNKYTRNKTLEKACDGNIEQSNVKILNQMNNDIQDYIEKSDVKSNVLNEKLVEIPLNKYIGVVQHEPTNFSEVSYLKTDNPDIYLKVWPTAVKIVKPKVVFEIGKLEALNFCPIVKDKNIPYTNDEIQKLVEVFVKKYYGKPIIITDSHKPHVVADNINESCIKNGKAYIVWANVCDCGCNRIGCHCKANLG